MALVALASGARCPEFESRRPDCFQQGALRPRTSKGFSASISGVSHTSRFSSIHRWLGQGIFRPSPQPITAMRFGRFKQIRRPDNSPLCLEDIALLKGASLVEFA